MEVYGPQLLDSDINSVLTDMCTSLHCKLKHKHCKVVAQIPSFVERVEAAKDDLMRHNDGLHYFLDVANEREANYHSEVQIRFARLETLMNGKFAVERNDMEKKLGQMEDKLSQMTVENTRVKSDVEKLKQETVIQGTEIAALQIAVLQLDK